MTITAFERNANITEMAVEMDRRGEVIERLEGHLADLTLDRDSLSARIEALEGENARLRERLKPFAQIGAEPRPDVPNVIGVELVFDNGESIGAIPYGDFRAAALQSSEADHG
jgi:hypothetical protein